MTDRVEDESGLVRVRGQEQEVTVRERMGRCRLDNARPEPLKAGRPIRPKHRPTRESHLAGRQAAGESWQSLGLSGEETFDVPDLNDAIQPGCDLAVTATSDDGTVKKLTVKLRIDTPVELEYYRNGGILQTVLRKLAL